jgi:hypothetical protein
MHKFFFMASEEPIPQFSIYKNPILCNLLNSLKKSLSVRHRQRPTEPSDLDPLAVKAETEGNTTANKQPNTLWDKILEYNALMDCLNNHSVILTTFTKALSSSSWPDDDTTDLQPLLTSKDVDATMRSSFKRSRSVAEHNGVYNPLPLAKRSESA